MRIVTTAAQAPGLSSIRNLIHRAIIQTGFCALDNMNRIGRYFRTLKHTWVTMGADEHVMGSFIEVFKSLFLPSYALQHRAAAPPERARAGGGRGGGRGGGGRARRGGGERGRREGFYDVRKNKLQDTLQHERDGEALLWEAAKDPSLPGLFATSLHNISTRTL